MPDLPATLPSPSPADPPSARARLRAGLPTGSSLPPQEFARRHRLLLALLWLHVPALLTLGLVQGVGLAHATVEALVVAVPAALATWVLTARKPAAALVALGLISASAVTVHLSGGYIEAHFHFFVMIVALTLYEDWLTFGIAAGYVLLHHGLMGGLAPETVYNHPGAVEHPWRWAAVHAGAVAAAGGFAIVAWRQSEEARLRQRQALHRALVAEERARAAAADLARSNEDLQRFAYVASHDLSEPLRTVSSFLGLLERRHGDRLDDEAREFVHWAVDGSARMQRMIDDLLEFSRAGREEPQLAPVDPAALTHEVLGGLQARLDGTRSRIEVAAMPAVLADRGQLALVLQNLLANAVKFADPQRRLVVRVEGHRRGDRVELAVQDNGVGIPAEHRESVFETFGRLHGREIDGSGIGLSVCRRVVERHGGRIWIEDPATGPGTRFVLTLAAAPDAPPGALSAADATRASAPGDPPAATTAATP